MSIIRSALYNKFRAWQGVFGKQRQLQINNDGSVSLGTGTSDIKTYSTADQKIISVYVSNSATSGDNRALYLRFYTTGTGGGGEAARIFHTVNNVTAGTAHGAHVSLSFGTTGKVSGLGVAGRNTLHVPATVTGTLAALQAEAWFDADGNTLAGATEHSLLRLASGGGNAAARQSLKNLISIVHDQDATGQMIYTNEHDPGNANGAIRILVNGTVKYLRYWAGEGAHA